MKVYKEDTLVNLAGECWSGAVDTLNELDDDELAIIEDCLEELYPYGMSMSELNDFLWFENDIIAEWLGFADWERLVSYHEETREEE